MNELTINVNLDNLSEKNRKLFMELIAEAKAKPNKVWKPKNLETVYYILNGSAVPYIWRQGVDEDEEAYALGEFFRTKEETEEEITRRKILKRWKDLSIESGETNNPWDGVAVHYYVHYDYHLDSLDCAWSFTCHSSDIYFSTHETLCAAIKEIGEENVKKYILNMKE